MRLEVGSIDRRVVASLLAFLLLVFLMTALLFAGAETDRAPRDDSVRVGSVVLGVDGGSSSCEGECSGGAGGDSVGGAGGTNFGGSSMPGSSGQAGAAGVPGLAGSPGTPGIPGSPGAPGSSGSETNSFQQSSFSESSESNMGDQAAGASPDQFVPVTPETTQAPPEAPPSTCAAGDLLGLGSLLAPLADILKLLNLC
jgi:hypothetical protein